MPRDKIICNNEIFLTNEIHEQFEFAGNIFWVCYIASSLSNNGVALGVQPLPVVIIQRKHIKQQAPVHKNNTSNNVRQVILPWESGSLVHSGCRTDKWGKNHKALIVRNELLVHEQF